MKKSKILMTLGLGLTVTALAQAGDEKAGLIASAKSAAPAVITEQATIKSTDGSVLVEGSNGWTCYPESSAMGPMCNDAQWDKLIGALMKQEPVDVEDFSISYMLAGEGDAPGVSNIDPYAAGPTEDNDWVKEGPHLMILVPDPAILEGMSTDPNDPVYVMWKDTPYAHIMVKIAKE